MTYIGKRLVFLRKRARLTQEEVSKRLHISRSHLGNLEKGVHEVKDYLIQDFTKLYGVSSSYLSIQPDCEKLRIQIKRGYHSLLQDDKENFIKINVLTETIDSPTQEMEIQLLKAIYAYQKREISEAEKIEKDYLSVFLPSFDLNKCSPDLKKIYLFYAFQKKFTMEKLKKVMKVPYVF